MTNKGYLFPIFSWGKRQNKTPDETDHSRLDSIWVYSGTLFREKLPKPPIHGSTKALRRKTCRGDHKVTMEGKQELSVAPLSFTER